MSHDITFRQRGWVASMACVGLTGVFVAAPPAGYAQRNPCPVLDHGLSDGVTTDTDPALHDYGLYLDPVPGLTTARHLAPARFSVPQGTVLTMFQSACASDEVLWDGASPLRREESGGVATCSMEVPGIASVRVQVLQENGSIIENACEVEVLDFELADIQVRGITLGKTNLPLTDKASNDETMEYYFGQSIAAVREIGVNRYITSVDRELNLNAYKLRPAQMGELTEWRVNGRAVALGTSLPWHFSQVGTHYVSVGPPDRQKEVVFETYHVRIKGFTPEAEHIPEGVPVTFEAVTEPPGYEDEITWLSSTKFGTGTPVLGHGPTFWVQFDATFGPNPDGGLSQWLGVKADDVVLGQDQESCTVNLTIYKSQNGLPVPEDKEVAVGSYTVANLNDTDGDGRVDNDETNVRRSTTTLSAAAAQNATMVTVASAAGFAVGDTVTIGAGNTYQRVMITAIAGNTITFTPALGQAFANGTAFAHAGRDEVDLMRLVLQGAGPQGKTFKLEKLSGNAKVWTDSTKQTEVVLPIKYTDNPLFKILWVEATAPSGALRDIALKLSCQGQGVDDTVRATGVWATVTAVLHDTTSAANIFDPPPSDPEFLDMTNPPNNHVNAWGGVGPRPIPTQGGVHNVIAIKFKIQPPGINAEPPAGGRGNPEFDGSRQVEHKVWTKTGAAACVEMQTSTFPLTEELPNDDASPEDKSNAPNIDDEYFDFDAPGVTEDDANADLYIMRANFKEFLRVRFDGTRPFGNFVNGSRCSPYYDWHVRHRLNKNVATGKWVRSDGEPPAAETANNDIGPGHIAIGICP